MIDTHCHLDDPRLEQNRNAMLVRARKAGVDRFIVAGTESEEWPRLQQLKNDAPGIFTAYGIHPWYCDRHHPRQFEDLAARLSDAVALGECGLDASRGKPDPEQQLWWLRRQLDMAIEHGLPVILHDVRASFPLLQELRARPALTGVVHGFSGSLEEALRFTEIGYAIGIGTMVLRENAKKVRKLAAVLPLSHMMLETDAPDGLPGDVLNEPANLVRIADRVAALRGEEMQVIIAASDANAIELFKL